MLDLSYMFKDMTNTNTEIKQKKERIDSLVNLLC